MLQFEFTTATSIVFGPGSIGKLAPLAAAFGKRALVVTGRDVSRAKRSLADLEKLGVGCEYFPIAGEPTLEAVRQGAIAALDVDFVLGFGGGSAIDAAKAIAAMATNSGEPLDYLEVIGKGQTLEKTPLPFLAAPTTAGTGAEVTRNAVLGSIEQGVKASLRSPLLAAKLALIDPDLCVGVPPAMTAATGLDTLTQLIEPFVSIRANALTDLYCVEGMRRAIVALPAAYRNGEDRSAREAMSFASLLSGFSLANAGLGAVHGFAAPLGGMLQAAHGAICAAILPHATAVNISALRLREPEHPSLGKYGEAVKILSHGQRSEPEALAPLLEELCLSLGSKPLRKFGLAAAAIPDLVAKASAASSMKANPIVLTTAELTEIVERAL